MIYDKVKKRKIRMLKDTKEIDTHEDGLPIYDLEIDLTKVFKVENNILKIDDEFREEYSLEIDDWYMALLISCNESIEWIEEYRNGSESIFVGQDWNGNYYSATIKTAPFVQDNDSIYEDSMQDDTMTWLLRTYNGIYTEKMKEVFDHLLTLRDTIKNRILIQKEKLEPKEIIYYEV